MATIVVSIICIAMIIVGGMTLSQGILTSADSTALNIDDMSLREGEMTRTDLDVVRAAYLSWGDLLRITVDNAGQTKLASFDKWDLIVDYYDSGGTHHIVWLPYTTGVLGDNEWQKVGIGLNGPVEFFEPDILNPEEELVILASLSPVPGNATTGNIAIAAPNGIYESVSFWNPGYTLLNPHSDNTTIAGTEYFQLKEATVADGPAMIMTTDAIGSRVTGRWLLHSESDATRDAKHVYPLTGISQIPASTWTVNYRCRTWGDPDFPRRDNDVNFDIDIIIRQADGTVRTIIDTNVADAYLERGEAETWLTKKANYNFSGYTVIDDSDYLEIVYYGECDRAGPDNGPGYMQIMIDDSTLPLADQTSIEG